MTDSKIYCELCNDTGWIVDKDNIATPCVCYKKRILSNRINFASIPETFKDIRLNSFNLGYYSNKAGISEVLNAVKYYLSHFEEMKSEGIGMYLWSETKGSGKTRMATSLGNEMIYEYEMSVRFITSLDIISEIKATWNKESELNSESQLMKYLNSVEVLIIDDFGTEKRDDRQNWIDDKFYQIVNSRYMNRLITIFTSNIPIDQLMYDSRITNRIKERVYEIHFPEESIRDGIAAARKRKMNNEIKERKNGQEFTKFR